MFRMRARSFATIGYTIGKAKTPSSNRRSLNRFAVAESPSITGVIGVWLLADEAHIVTIAVRESHRRRGIAELLLIRAIELARTEEQQLVTLECRVSNAPALALYDKYGFEKVGLRQRYYSDNHEDAYVLSLNPVRSRRFKEHFEALKAEHEQRWGPFDIEG